MRSWHAHIGANAAQSKLAERRGRRVTELKPFAKLAGPPAHSIPQIERAETVTYDTIQQHDRQTDDRSNASPNQNSSEPFLVLEAGLSLEEVERRYVTATLRGRGYGELGQVANRLGISRKTLWEKRRRYGHDIG